MTQGHRRQGAVSVEVVVMLPVFVALLASVSYLHGLAAAAQSAGLAARACAWSFALEACEGELPKVCRERGIGAPEELTIQLLGGEVEATPPGSTTFRGSWFDTLAGVPVLGQVFTSIFGVGRRIKATRQTPRDLDRRVRALTMSTYVVCSPRAKAWSAKVQDIFDRVSKCDGRRDPLCGDNK